MRPEILNPLFEPVTALEGVGPKLAEAMSRLLRSADPGQAPRVGSLLFHLPHSIIDRRHQPGIANATDGIVSTFKVHVDRHFPPPRGNKRVPYRINVHDSTGEMTLVFFRAQSKWLENAMPEGTTRYVSGKPEWFNGKLNMVHPEHMVSEEEFADLPMVEPVYPLTAGLSTKILGKSIRTALKQVPILPEWIETGVMAREQWPSFNQAISALHNPENIEDLIPSSPARTRLAYDELLSGQLALAMLRNRLRKSSGKSREGDDRLVRELFKHLPFDLTGAQKRSAREIFDDMAKPERMLRLLQGDVGSGKTIVALIAMLRAVECGEQAAIMAPTEILARQHLASMQPLCEKLGLSIDLLTGKDKASVRNRVLEGMKSGELDIVIGTHALFQNRAEFKSLGLAIIDEQHRFGVHQRLNLGDKGSATDVLVMTATPIPRTLVLTNYGDMDVSKLDEKPAGRQPIVTNAISAERIEELFARIFNAIGEGQKVYWICPLVEESEEVKATAAEDRYADIKSRTDTPVGLVHGRMKPDEKEEAMAAFKSGETKLLVATTVIEVGVDVPDATIIVIEQAERFGLAQLHQLRGRVGRGDKASTCILLYDTPLSETAKARLNVMRQTEDGFKIAEEDLRLRGEGEILGTRQSGTPGFSLVDFEHHSHLLDIARDQARLVVTSNPDLDGEVGEALRIMLYLFGQDQAVRLIRSG